MAAAPLKKSSASSSSSDATSRGLKQTWRIVWFATAAVVFGILTSIAFSQMRLREISRLNVFTLSWWLKPIEFNPDARINRVEPGVDFNCISALPGAEDIWVGGSKGVIIHSSDAGKTWKQLLMVTASTELKAEPVPQKSLAPQTSPPAKTKAPPAKKASYSQPSMPASSSLATEIESDDWIQVGLPEGRPSPDFRQQQQVAPNAANQSSRVPNIPNAPSNLRIEETPPSNPANQAAPEDKEIPSTQQSPSKTERGVTGMPGIQRSQSPTPSLPPVPTVLTSNNIVDLAFVNRLDGFALTSVGEFLATHDGAVTWRLMNPIAPDRAFAVRIKFIDAKRGVAVGSFGVARTLDGGEVWKRSDSTPALVADIAFTDEILDGWAVGLFKGIFAVHQDDPGPRFGSQIIQAVDRIEETPQGRYSKQPNFNGITRAGPNTFFACGDTGVIVRLEGAPSAPSVSRPPPPPPQRSRVIKTEVSDNLYRIFFATEQYGWAVGRNGLVKATTDRGEHWEKHNTPAGSDLRAVYFDPNSSGSVLSGYVAGNNGAVLATSDGGENWYPVVMAGSPVAGGYGRLPAPWYFVSLILLFGFVRSIPPPVQPTRSGIVDLFTSDKPIGPKDPDYLGFQQTTLGLSNYLRNKATKAPLTIAITGEWGMGKSSLMNLVSADLSSYKFRPVWFNAWHHQTEESLLAALLENVRTQALPSVFSPEGIVFRTKLLWRRARKNLLVFLLVVAAVSFCAPYFATTNPTELAQRIRFWQQMQKNQNSVVTIVNGVTSALSNDHTRQALLAIVSAIAALVAVFKGLRAFGVDPSSLLASKSNAAKAKDLRAQTSFRYQFEKQFRDVADSLKPLTMVLFVDDLDRCRPDEVYDMLESINFLVSCGDCFVVMGLARRRVERCVGLVFDKVAAEGPGIIDGHRLSRAEQRQRFAQTYLEKLINIEVPVPKGGLDQIRTLLINKRLEQPQRSKLEIAGEKVGELLPHLVPAGLAIATAIIAAWCSVHIPKNLGIAATAPAPTPPPQVEAALESPRPGATPPPALPVPTPSQTGTGFAKFFPGQSDRSPIWAIVILGVGILTPGVIRLSRKPGSVIEDSPAFVSALDKWFPVLVDGQDPTPRAIKRFVNRVRYFAMMENSFRPARRWWERLAEFWKRRKETPPAPTITTHEDLLVALATVHERHPAWFAGDFQSFIQTARTESETIAADVTAISPATYDQFKRLVAGVEIH